MGSGHPFELASRFFRRGYAPLVLSGALVYLTGFGFRSWQARASDERGHVKAAVRTLLRTETEPRRDERYVTAVAVAMASGAVDASFSCANNDHLGAAPCRLLDAMESRLPDWGLMRSVDWEPGPCAGLDRFENATAREARCARIEEGGRLVGEIYVPANSEQAKEEYGRAGQVTRHVFAPHLWEVGRSRGIDEPLITSIFYVTSNGTLADYTGDRDVEPAEGIWFRGSHPPAGDTVKHYDSHGSLYQLRDRSYVEFYRQRIQHRGRATAERTRFHSRPYLDLAGGGLVRTSCVPDMAPLDSGSDSDAGGFFGVLCVDYSLPFALTIEDGDLQRLLDMAVVEVPGNPSALDGELTGTLERAARELPNATKTQPLVPLGNAFAVPLRALPHEADAPKQLWLLLAPASARLDWGLIAFLASALLCVFIASGTVIVRTSRQREETELSMLRNLQVGVVHVDGGAVVGANDRAEELLGVPLPPLGARDFRELDLRDHFEDVGLYPLGRDDVRERDGWGAAPPSASTPRLIDWKEVDERRADGESFRYYMRLRDARPGESEDDERRWIEIWGTPFLTVSSGKRLGEHPARTFAVLREPRDQEKLTRVWTGLVDAEKRKERR